MCSIMAFGVPKVLYGEEYVSTLQWAPVRHLDCAIACHTNTTTLNARSHRSFLQNAQVCSHTQASCAYTIGN